MRMLEDYELLDIQHARWLAGRPKCSVCGEHIADERAVHIEDYWICMECIETNKEWIDDDD